MDGQTAAENATPFLKVFMKKTRKPPSLEPGLVDDLADIFGAYNEGLIGLGHCD